MWALTTLVLTTAPLGFDAAVALADDAPVVAGARRAAHERTAVIGQLSPLPSNPQLTFQPGFRTLPNQPAGPEGFVVVAQSFNLGGLSAAKRAVAAGEAVSAAASWQLQRAEFRVAVARTWLDGWAAHVALEALRQESADVTAVVARLARAASAGGVTRVEHATTRAFSAELRAQILDWEERELDARLRLASLLSLEAPPTLSEVAPELQSPHLTKPVEERMPHVRLVDAERRLEELRAEEVAAQWAPQLQASLQFGHEWQGQWVGYAGLGFTLPVFERGQREQAAHRAAQSKLEGVLLGARRDVHVEWRRLEHELEHTQEALHVVKDEQLPAALEAALLEQRRADAGEATLIEVTTLRRQAVAARVATILAEANVLAARHRAIEFLRLNEEVP